MIKLSKLLSMIMPQVDGIEYYNKNITLICSLPIYEVPENCEDKIIKFNICKRGNKRILQVIKK